jgi:hypothetical protein
MKRQGRVCLILLGCALLGFSLTAGLCAPRGTDAAGASCIELLRNGSFEAGGQDWQQYSAQAYELISDFNPRTGRLGAYLAGVNNASDRISQQVALPPAPTALTLEAWWYLATAETAGSFDTMTVSLLRADGTWVATLVTVDNTAPVGLWDKLVFDLAPYAGQTVIIRFEAHTDANNISDFYLDDVSLMACTAEVTMTAAATPTRTATATGTSVSSPTATNTSTATSTVSRTPTGSPTATRTPTATSKVSQTPVGSPRATATQTFTPGVSPSATWTVTPTLEGQTATPTITASLAPRHHYLPYISALGGLP